MKRLSGLALQNLYFIFTFIILGAAMIFTVLFLTWFGIDAEPNQTSVGIIYLGDLSEEQYGQRIEAETNIWKSTAYYEVFYQGETFRVDLNLFSLNLNATLDGIEQNQQNRAIFYLTTQNHTRLLNDLKAFFTEDVMVEVNLNQLISDIQTEMGRLIRRKSFALVSYASQNLVTHLVDSVVIGDLTEEQVNLMSTIDPIIVLPYSRFSTLKALEVHPLSNDEMSILATAMLTVSLKSNFTGFAFASYPEDPNWAYTNYHVRILRLNRYDLTFFNNLNQAFTFFIEKESDTSIRVSLFGYPYLNQYTVEERLRFNVNYSTIEHFDIDFDETDEAVEIVIRDETEYYRLKVQDGVNGRVKSYFRIISRLGEIIEELRLFEVQERPISEIYYYKLVEIEGEDDGA